MTCDQENTSMETDQAGEEPGCRRWPTLADIAVKNVDEIILVRNNNLTPCTCISLLSFDMILAPGQDLSPPQNELTLETGFLIFSSSRSLCEVCTFCSARSSGPVSSASPPTVGAEP